MPLYLLPVPLELLWKKIIRFLWFFSPSVCVYSFLFNSINSQIKLTLTRFVDMKQEYHLNLVKTTRVCHVNIKNIVIKNRLHAISTMSFYHNTIINYLNKTNKHKQQTNTKQQNTQLLLSSFLLSSSSFPCYTYIIIPILFIFFFKRAYDVPAVIILKN